MAVKLNFVIALRKVIGVFNLAFRIRDANWSGALAFVCGVPHRFYAALALVPPSFEDAFERDRILRDAHAVDLDASPDTMISLYPTEDRDWRSRCQETL